MQDTKDYQTITYFFKGVRIPERMGVSASFFDRKTGDSVERTPILVFKGSVQVNQNE